MGQRDPLHERLDERVGEPAHVEERAHASPEVRQDLLEAVPLPEDHAVEPALDRARQRGQRDRQKEGDHQIFPQRESVLRLKASFEQDAETDHERQHAGHEAAVDPGPLGDDAHVHQPVADHRDAEQHREQRIRGDPERVHPLQRRHYRADEIHVAAEEADDRSPEDELGAVPPEARLDPSVCARELHQPGQHEDLKIHEEDSVHWAAHGHVSPFRELHGPDEQRRQVEDHEGRRERVRGDEDPAPALAQAQEEQDEVVIQRRNRNHSEEHRVLPEERAVGAPARPEHEHAEVPDRLTAQEVGEGAIDPAVRVSVEDERDQREVQRQRDQRDEIMDCHGARRRAQTGSSLPSSAALRSHP